MKATEIFGYSGIGLCPIQLLFFEQRLTLHIPKEVWELYNSPLEGTFSLPREREMAVCPHKRWKYAQHIERPGFLGLCQDGLPGSGPVCTRPLKVARLLRTGEGDEVFVSEREITPSF